FRVVAVPRQPHACGIERLEVPKHLGTERVGGCPLATSEHRRPSGPLARTRMDNGFIPPVYSRPESRPVYLPTAGDTQPSHSQESKALTPPECRKLAADQHELIGTSFAHDRTFSGLRLLLCQQLERRPPAGGHLTESISQRSRGAEARQGRTLRGEVT